MSTLGEEFPKEQARVRDVLKQYESLGVAGALGAALIRQTLAEADQAAISGDLVRMIAVYEELKAIN